MLQPKIRKLSDTSCRNKKELRKGPRLQENKAVAVEE